MLNGADLDRRVLDGVELRLQGVLCLVIVDSSNRITGTSSNFTAQLQLPKNNRYDHVLCMQFSCPKSFYTIPADNDTFTLEEKSSTTTVTLIPGNYSRTSLKSTLKTLLDNASVVLGNNWVYTVSVPSSTSADTGKFTFSVAEHLAKR